MPFTPKKSQQLEEDEEQEEEEVVTSKFAQRLQKLKAKHTKPTSDVNTPSKLAVKLLELDNKKEEEEGQEEEEEGDEELEDNGEEEEGEEESEDEWGDGAEEGGEGEEEEDGVLGSEQTEKTGTQAKKKETKAEAKTKKASKQWAMYFDDELPPVNTTATATANEIKTINTTTEMKEEKKPLSKEELDKMKQDIENRGVIYLSTVPPNYAPDKLKHYFHTNFGNVTRIHLSKKSVKELKQYEQQRGHRSNQFYKEGWIEFKDKNVAKRVATCLSGTQVGGHRVEGKAVWNIRYLSKFKWNFLQEKLYNQKAEATKVMNQKLEEAKRDVENYREQTDQAKKLDKKTKRVLKAQSTPIPQKTPKSAKVYTTERKRLPVLSQIVPSKRPKIEDTK